MKRFFKSNITSMVLVLITLLNFLLIALAGIATTSYYAYYNYNYKYYDYSYYSLYSGALGVIFIPIMAFILLILVPLTILNKFGKLRYVKLHKFMSAFDFFAISGLSIAQFVLLLNEYSLSDIGIFIATLLLENILVTLFATIVSVYQFCTMLDFSANPNQGSKVQVNNRNAIDNLKALKELYDQGILTEEEYNEKKKKYIDLL